MKRPQFLVALLILCASVSVARAQVNSSSGWQVNFHNAQLRAPARIVSQAIGAEIYVETPLAARTVTFVADAPDAQTLFKDFEAALEVNGLTMRPNEDGSYTVVPISGAASVQ